MSPVFREDPAEKIKCRKNMLGGRARVECEEEKGIREIYFGDAMKEKKTNTLWLVSQNCNGILKQNNLFTFQMKIENFNLSNYDVLL